MKESDISREIQVALSLEGARVFRNNVGLFETKDGRAIRTGLCEGSSDLIGWTHHGKFLSIEVKTLKGLQSYLRKGNNEKQKNFINRVNAFGGVGFVAASVESAVRQYKERTK